MQSTGLCGGSAGRRGCGGAEEGQASASKAERRWPLGDGASNIDECQFSRCLVYILEVNARLVFRFNHRNAGRARCPLLTPVPPAAVALSTAAMSDAAEVPKEEEAKPVRPAPRIQPARCVRHRHAQTAARAAGHSMAQAKPSPNASCTVRVPLALPVLASPASRSLSFYSSWGVLPVQRASNQTTRLIQKQGSR